VKIENKRLVENGRVLEDPYDITSEVDGSL